jgi:hypothetical protein
VRANAQLSLKEVAAAMFNNFSNWAGSQPVWIQVLIGMTLFFIGLPLAGLTLYLSFRAVFLALDAVMPMVVDIGTLVLKLAAVFVLLLSAWLLTEQAALFLSLATGDHLSLSPRKFDQLRLWTHVALIAILSIGSPLALFIISKRFRSWVVFKLRTIRRWKQELDGEPQE